MEASETTGSNDQRAHYTQNGFKRMKISSQMVQNAPQAPTACPKPQHEPQPFQIHVASTKNDVKHHFNNGRETLEWSKIPVDVIEHHLRPALSSVAMIRVLRKVCRHYRDCLPVPHVRIDNKIIALRTSPAPLALCESLELTIENFDANSLNIEELNQNIRLKRFLLTLTGKITSTDVASICQVLSKTTHLEELHLNVGSLAVRDAKRIVEALGSSQQLSTLILRRFSNALEPFVEYAIDHKIHKFVIRYAGINANAFARVVEWLASPACSWTHFSLRDMRFSSNQFKQLLNAIRVNQSLLCLKIRTQDLTIAALAAAIEQGKIRTLYVGSLYVQDATVLLKTLLQSKQSIELVRPEFDLDDEIEATPEIIDLTCRYLKSTCGPLSYIMIHQCVALADSPRVLAALAQNSTLTSLDAAMCGGNMDPVITILQSSKSVTRFTFANFSDEEISRPHDLISAVKLNRTLQYADIDIYGATRKIEWIPDFFAAFSFVGSLREFRAHFISDFLAPQVQLIISGNPTLTHLNFRQGNLTNKGLGPILQEASKLTLLKSLVIESILGIEDRDESFNEALFKTISTCPLECLVLRDMPVHETVLLTIIKAARAREIIFLHRLVVPSVAVSAAVRQSLDELAFDTDGILRIEYDLPQ